MNPPFRAEQIGSLLRPRALFERLGLSPQCGFASHRHGTALAFADQEAKLRQAVETAAAVWGAN